MLTRYINLDPHPEEIANWRQSGYLPDEPRVSKGQSIVLAAIGKGKVITLADPASEDPSKPREEKLCIETVEDTDRPIKRTVHKIFRTPSHLYFTQVLRGQNFSGDKRLDTTQIVGKYNFTEFAKLRNRETGQVTVSGIADVIQKYEIPFTAGEFKDPSTGENTTIEALPKSETCQYYVVAATRKYALNAISLHDFLNRSFEELVEYGKNGKWPEKPIETTETSTRKRQVKSDE